MGSKVFKGRVRPCLAILELKDEMSCDDMTKT